MSGNESAHPSLRSLFNPATIIVACSLALTLLGLTILFSASAWFRRGAGAAPHHAEVAMPECAEGAMEKGRLGNQY